MKIAAFSKYLAYNIGGAEKSTLSLLNERSSVYGDSIALISVENPTFLGSKPIVADVSDGWTVDFLKLRIQLNRFSYSEYVFNRSHLMRIFKDFEYDELWVYGSLAPAAALGFVGNVKYYVRSESDLGVLGNYHQGCSYYAKMLYKLFEYPALNIYRRDLQTLFSRATVIANSKYMSSRAFDLFGINAEVLYPIVDISGIKDNLDKCDAEKMWVVFVGDSPVKGLHHVIKVARHLPDVNFRIVSRFVDEPRQEGNIRWVPWETEPWRVYSGARLVIVPSQWEEAYGRVAREAYLLGIPVLVSAVGGLPEAVDEDSACLVEDYQSPEAWRQAIKNALSSAPSQRFSE